MGKSRRKIQPAGPLSRKLSQVNTNSSPPHKLMPKNIHFSEIKTLIPTKQPTPSKIRCFSLGREKFEQLLDFKRWLDQERKSIPHPGSSRSTPSSPKQRTIGPPTTPPPCSMPPPPSLTLLKQKNSNRTVSSSFNTSSNRYSPATTCNPKETAAEFIRNNSGDEVPKQRKKGKLRHHTGSNICRVNKGVLERLNKV